MRVLLFDLYTGGHHLELASELHRRLEEEYNWDVDVLFPARSEREGEFFPDATPTHLYAQSPLEAWSTVPDRQPLPAISRFLRTGVLNRRWSVMRDVVDFIDHTEYDVVHCLEMDKLTAAILCQAPAIDCPFVASINGVFFKPTTAPIQPSPALRKVLDKRLCSFLRWAPPALRKGSSWDEWLLDQCLDRSVVHKLTVASEPAKEVIRQNEEGQDRRISVVPDPVPSWSEMAQEDARAHVELPEDGPVLLSFGRLVEEKGIRTLMAALRRYDGGELTVVFAGSPVAVDGDELRSIDTAASLTIETRLEYIPQHVVPAYFYASDGVLLPYDRSFGELRTSNVFNKACIANRPIIASSFGVIGERVRNWNLGMVVESGDPQALADAMESFVARSGDVHDPETMAAFADTQTFDVFAEKVNSIYADVIEDPTRTGLGDE